MRGSAGLVPWLDLDQHDDVPLYLQLYEQVRREIERVSFEELDRMAVEIKAVIEALLKMDYELRKVHNLKLAFETRAPGTAASG